MTYYKPRRRWGKFVLVIVVLLLLGVGIAAFLFFRSGDDDAKQASQPLVNPQLAENKAGDARAAGNTARRADADALMVAVKTYMNNNHNQAPTAFTKGRLSGGEGSVPQSVTFKHYQSLAVVIGKQSAVKGDVIRLVTAAVCADASSATGDAPTSGPVRFVIQFSLQTSDKALNPQCKET